MKICPTNLMSINARCNQIAFKMEDSLGGAIDYKYPSHDYFKVVDDDTTYEKFADKDIKTTYHYNGRIAKLNIKYANEYGKKLTLNEEYDEYGKNINCKA